MGWTCGCCAKATMHFLNGALRVLRLLFSDYYANVLRETERYVENRESKPDSVFWVGGIGRAERNFHGYTTERGSTYNAYLILDEKIAHRHLQKPLHGRSSSTASPISSIPPPSTVVSNHGERWIIPGTAFGSG